MAPGFLIESSIQGPCLKCHVSLLEQGVRSRGLGFRVSEPGIRFVLLVLKGKEERNVSMILKSVLVGIHSPTLLSTRKFSWMLVELRI